MDYNSKIKEILGKLLFLEMNIDGFKKNVGIPDYIIFENKELYLPISSSYISSNINDEIKLNNLPIYYFIEGMFTAMGCDENLKFNNDYETILDSMKDTENCIKSLISKKINNDELLDGYILLKGYYRYSHDVEVMKKLLLVGESIREKDSTFSDMLLSDISYCEEKKLKITDIYLYKAMILKDKGDFKGAEVSVREYENSGGKITPEIEVLFDDITNVLNYEKAIESLKDDPAKSIELLLGLSDKFEENPLIDYYIGLAFRMIGQYKKAIHYLEESIRKESGILEVVAELGLNYACLEEYERALMYFRKAFEASREIGLCTNIIMCYINMKDIENAKLHYDIAKAIDSEDEVLKDIERILFKKK